MWQAVDTSGVSNMAIDFAHGQRQYAAEQIVVLVGSSAPPRKTSASNVINWEALGFQRVLVTTSDSLQGWDRYQALVEIPLGQDTTYVVFEAIGGAPGLGNFLDDVKLSAANSMVLSAYDIQLSHPDDANLKEAKITLTNAEIGDILVLEGLLPAGLTSTATIANGAIAIRVAGSASLADYQSIVNRIAFSSSSTVAGTRLIDIVVNDGVFNSNKEVVSIQYA